MNTLNYINIYIYIYVNVRYRRVFVITFMQCSYFLLRVKIIKKFALHPFHRRL